MFATEAEARAWLSEIERDVRRGSHWNDELSSTTFATYFETVYWPGVKKAEGTLVQQDALYRNHIKPRWGAIELRAITTPAIKEWRTSLADRPYAERIGPKGKPWQPQGTIGTETQRQTYWLFHQAMNMAVEDGYLVRSPMPVKSGLPTSQPKPPEHVLRPDEVERLANEHDEPDLIYVLAYAGLRQGEAFGLRVKDIDFGRSTIRVDEKVRECRGQVVIETILKTSRSHRVVPVPKWLTSRLLQRVQSRELRSSDLLFTTSAGTPIGLANWRARTLKPAAKRAGFEGLTGHDLRHTAASLWFERFDIVEVARLLGDTLRVAEQTYVHVYQHRSLDVVALMDDLVPAPAA